MKTVDEDMKLIGRRFRFGFNLLMNPQAGATTVRGAPYFVGFQDNLQERRP